MILNEDRLRERDLINESAGDVPVTKAVVLAPNYNPTTIDLKKVFSFGVHAVYNSYMWNTIVNQVSKGILLSHSDIVIRNHIAENRIIGYFVKENGEVLEYELMRSVASKFLSDEQIDKIELELKEAKW